MVGQALEQFPSCWAGFCAETSHGHRDTPEKSRILVVWVSERPGRSDGSVYLNPLTFHSSLETGGGTLNILTQVYLNLEYFWCLGAVLIQNFKSEVIFPDSSRMHKGHVMWQPQVIALLVQTALLVESASSFKNIQMMFYWGGYTIMLNADHNSLLSYASFYHK